MNKNFLISLTLLCMISSSVPVTYAQTKAMEEDTSKETTRMTPPVKKEKTVKEATRSAMKNAVMELKTDLSEKREEAKKEFQKERDEFQEQLEDIKDAQKQKIVERVDTRLAEINTLRTDLLLQHLERMAHILTTIEEKAADLDDHTSVDAAIARARDVIATAESAIADQAAKEYIIDLSSVTVLKSTVQETVAQFKSDMKATIATVQAAREATIQAARALAGIRDPVTKETGAMMKDDATDASESAN